MKFTHLFFCTLLITSAYIFAQHDKHLMSENNEPTYICPMHPNIKQNEFGTCPICGMDLVLLDEKDDEHVLSSDDESTSQLTIGNHKGHTHQQMYTCPMHPNIKQNEAGTCPICGMDLVPLEVNETTDNMSEESIKIPKATRRLAGIETEKVDETVAFQKLRAVGFIDFDEGRVSTIAAYVDGRIEKLYANYTGVKVKKDEHLAEFYSPELYSAQVEYIQAGDSLSKMQGAQLENTLSTQRSLLLNAERKLKELGMSKTQIRMLKKTRKAKSRLILDSPTSGTVIEKNVMEGTYVNSGQIIYKVADLSSVWLLLDMFPEETTYLKYGLKVTANIRSAPDRHFEGRVSFISPVIDRKTRTVRVRVEIPNSKGILRPGDFADASILVPVGNNGVGTKTYDKNLAGKYIAPMHPQEISDKPGKCPICGMEMIPAAEFGYSENIQDLEKVITVPRNAILSVGEGHVVFVENEPDRFVLREIVMGPIVEGNRVVVIKGLKIGDTVASSGVFLIDSQMQLSGKTSLIQISSKRN